MQCITESQVDETWQTVAQMDPELVMDTMMDFSQAQPNLLGFVMAFAEDLEEEDAQELSTYMLYVIYQMFVNSSEKPIPMITEEQIKHQYEVTCDLIDSLHEEDPNDDDVEMEIQNQPHVYKYVSETLFEDPDSPDDELSISDESAGELFLLMKCVIDAVDAATN